MSIDDKMAIPTQDLTHQTTDMEKNEKGEDDEAGDDLHAFFDEVEHVAQQVNGDDGDDAVEPMVAPPQIQPSTNDNESKKRPLEHNNESNSNGIEQSTSKKVKTTPLPPQVPRGVVVASAAAAAAPSATNASSSNTTITNASNQRLSYPTTQSAAVSAFNMMPSSSIPIGSSSTFPLQQTYSVGPTFPPPSASLPYTTSTTANIPPISSSYQLTSQQVGTTTTAVPVTTTTNNNNATSTTNSTKQTKPHIRQVAGKVWVDPTLSDWPDNDFRIFVGNLDPNVTDEQLYQHFAQHYPSLNQVRIIRDKKKNNVSLGYGFVSLLDPLECAKAIREQDQSWLGGRPIRIKRSHWKDRELHERQQKQKHNSSAISNHKHKKRR